MHLEYIMYERDCTVSPFLVVSVAVWLRCVVRQQSGRSRRSCQMLSEAPHKSGGTNARLLHGSPDGPALRCKQRFCNERTSCALSA